MRCPYCGKDNADYAQFCSGCGTTFRKTEEWTHQGKGARWLVLFLLVIIVALAAAAFAIFYFDLFGLKESDDGNGSEQTAVFSSVSSDSEDSDVYENDEDENNEDDTDSGDSDTYGNTEGDTDSNDIDYTDPIEDPLEAYQAAIEMLSGSAFTMEMSVYSYSYIGDDWDDREYVSEYDYDARFTVNVNDNNLDSMTMSGYCEMYRGSDYSSWSEYRFYYEDGTSYYSYASPSNIKISDTGQPTSALLDFLWESTFTDDDLTYSGMYDGYISLDVDGSAFDLTELMYEVLDGSYDYSCDEVYISLTTDYAGRPLELDVWFYVEFEDSDVSVTATYSESITFSNYEPAKVIRPSDLDSYIDASS